MKSVNRVFQQGAIQHAAEDPADDWHDPEQPQLLQRPAAWKIATAVLRAGLTEVLVTGMLIKWMRVSARPMAMGAKPAGACLSVAP